MNHQIVFEEIERQLREEMFSKMGLGGLHLKDVCFNSGCLDTNMVSMYVVRKFGDGHVGAVGEYSLRDGEKCTKEDGEALLRLFKEKYG